MTLLLASPRYLYLTAGIPFHSQIAKSDARSRKKSNLARVLLVWCPPLADIVTVRPC